jgi:transposase
VDAEGMHPVVTITGSHQKTCVFGVLSINGIQFFRQYSTFDQDRYVPAVSEGIAKEV